MTGWFSRRSGSRVSIQNPVRPRASGTKVFRETLCPLGQPEKAIGHEPQIEPWLALHNHSACLRQEPKGIDTNSIMNLREKEQHRVSSQYWGWTARSFLLGRAVVGEAFVLTSPFIERDYRKLAVTRMGFSPSQRIMRGE